MSEGLTVLGIDAAWTARNPSGVALVQRCGGIWWLRAIAPSYQGFVALSDTAVAAEQQIAGGAVDVYAILEAASFLCDRKVDLVAIDMPLARSAIVGRRVSDNEVSKTYGARGCGTHSLSAFRPGPLGAALTGDFEHEGYRLVTTQISLPGLLEVYPHPALVELLGAKRRLPYKVGRARSYWPDLSASERIAALREQWKTIVAALDRRIGGIGNKLFPPSPDAKRAALKAYEDMLDAMICAWVGICALEGRARPFGDYDTAIWVPVPTV